MTKSNLYRYFGSREEILLVLLHEETRAFAKDFAATIRGRHLGVAELGSLIAEYYEQKPLLCDLLCVAATVLEHNAELENIRDIKVLGLEDADTTAMAIAQSVSGTDENQAAHIGCHGRRVVASGPPPRARTETSARQRAGGVNARFSQ